MPIPAAINMFSIWCIIESMDSITRDDGPDVNTLGIIWGEPDLAVTRRDSKLEHYVCRGLA